jgi:hypothetical protein
MSENEEESMANAFCRVCHGESEPNRELYYPCKCDGSIKYVHQDCLKEWLKHAREKTKCELCGEKFRFKKLYNTAIPDQLTILELFRELIPRIISVIKLFVKLTITCLAWGILVPIFLNYWLRLCWCVVSEEEVSMCFEKFFGYKNSINNALFAWYSGLFQACVIGIIAFFIWEAGRVFLKVFYLKFVFKFLFFFFEIKLLIFILLFIYDRIWNKLIVIVNYCPLNVHLKLQSKSY